MIAVLRRSAPLTLASLAAAFVLAGCEDKKTTSAEKPAPSATTKPSDLSPNSEAYLAAKAKIRSAKILHVNDSFDFVTAGGKVYQDVVVQSVYPDGVSIMHSEGVAKLPYESLNATLLAKYKFNPAQALEYRRATELVAKVEKAK